MRTLIVSDLHLGSVSGTDLLRRPELRAPLLEAARECDRMVLLGDVLELRHGPPREALAAARPFFEDLGRALEGSELVLVAGNHDHALIEPWLARRGEQPDPAPLGVEQLLDPAEASSAYAQLAAWSAPATVRVAYPGLWLRPDVYATHGHYLDCHLTVPTLERLSVGAMSRMLGRHPATFDRVSDYEAVGAPVFAWRDAVARQERTGGALNGVATVNAWRALGGAGGSRDGARRPPASSLRWRACARSGGAPDQPRASCNGARSWGPSRWRWPRSTARASGRCDRTSPPSSCAVPDSRRWARWPRTSVSATRTWFSATPTGPGRCPATKPPSGAEVEALSSSTPAAGRTPASSSPIPRSRARTGRGRASSLRITGRPVCCGCCRTAAGRRSGRRARGEGAGSLVCVVMT